MSESLLSPQEVAQLCQAELYSAVLCDTLDSFGLRNQSPQASLRLLEPDVKLCGYARVGLYMPVYHDSSDLDVYGEEIDLVDSLKPGDIPVLCCHGMTHIAPWGELLSTRSKVVGAAGCVTDGSIRDLAMIRKIGFQVAYAGTNPVDTKYRGKLMLYDVPGQIDRVRIESGDLIFMDEDGMVVLPQDHIQHVVTTALEKVRKETTIRTELVEGRTLRQIFTDHGIL
ncbi:MAG: RraA family protein [Rhodobacteraceae bacterium]|nr:RraA family protein [Paracoccaceae bacterium]